MRDGGAPADGEDDCGTTGEEGLGDGHATRVRHPADQRLTTTEALDKEPYSGVT